MGRTLSRDDWQRIEAAFLEPMTAAGEIARMRGFADRLEPNLDAGVNAVLNGLSATDATNLSRVENLTRFLELCGTCRTECVSRIGRLPQPQTTDVEQVHVATRLRIDEKAARMLKPPAFREFEDLLQDLNKTTVNTLRAKLGEDATAATKHQVRDAFSTALNIVTKRVEPARYWGLVAAQIVGTVVLSTHGLVYSWNPQVGLAMLVAGILIGVYMIVHHGKKL